MYKQLTTLVTVAANQSKQFVSAARDLGFKTHVWYAKDAERVYTDASEADAKSICDLSGIAPRSVVVS